MANLWQLSESWNYTTTLCYSAKKHICRNSKHAYSRLHKILAMKGNHSLNMSFLHEQVMRNGMV